MIRPESGERDDRHFAFSACGFKQGRFSSITSQRRLYKGRKIKTGIFEKTGEKLVSDTCVICGKQKPFYTQHNTGELGPRLLCWC